MLPTLSVLVAALVLLGPGSARPSIGARIRGAPVDGSRTLALRLEIVRALYEVIDGGGEHDVLVEASAPGQTLRAWHGPTGPDGIAEVRLEGSAPIRGPVAVAVTALTPRQRIVAAGSIALRPPSPLTADLVRIAGNTRGDLDVRVQATRGLLASPFVETLRVIVSPAQRAEITLEGAGFDASPAKVTTDDRGVALFAVTPLAHQIELGVAVRAGDKSARWEGTLPVVPGAMWIAPSSASETARRALLSPAPRERAYVSFWSDEGRAGGAVVPLAKNARGFFEGAIDVPDAAGSRVLFASVAGDPLEQGAGTVSWPLRPAEGAVVAPPMALLLDGLPAAQEREAARAAAARRAGLWLVGAAALAEILLLLAVSRSSQRALEAHFVQASDALPEADRARLLDAAREHPVLRALLAAALVGLAFALAAALSSFR